MNAPIAPAEGLSGADLVAMLASATACLERHAQAVNALNVFPVPDGDTGTNMLLTVKGALHAAAAVQDDSAFIVAGAMSQGALMSARGNSGVILSQIISGFSAVLRETEQETMGGVRFAKALRAGSNRAYQAVSSPVEGTILTVARRAAEAAETAPDGYFLASVVAAYDAAVEAVAATPSQLKILADAGVVDAGGQGFVYILEGIRRFLEGNPILPATADELGEATEIQFANLDALEAFPYGYCTEFLISGTQLDPEAVRAHIRSLGESVLVVGDDTLVRIHVHTFDPGAALSFGIGIGSLGGVKVDNMQDQAEAFQAAKRRQDVSAAPIAVVAVAQGSGFGRVMRSLGVSRVISGGQTMNPSTADFIKAIEECDSDRVVVLPNNANVILAAQQAVGHTAKQVSVIPTRTMVQGIAAMVAFVPGSDADATAGAMLAASKGVRTLEVTRAVRSTVIDGISVGEGQFLALVDDRLTGVSGDATDAIRAALRHQSLADGEFVTIYYGKDATRAEANEVAALVQRILPDCETEVVQGGQPHYPFILSIE